jgi:hypothetical protein
MLRQGFSNSRAALPRQNVLCRARVEFIVVILLLFPLDHISIYIQRDIAVARAIKLHQ